MPVSRRGFLRLVGTASPLSGRVPVRARARGALRRGAGPGPGARRARRCRRASTKSASAATRIRSVPARPRSTRFSASSPRRGATRSTARRPTATWSPRIADEYKVKPENVVLGAGSQEILKSAMRAWVSPTRALVTALPTFENCTGYAKRYKLPITEVKVDAAMRLDVEAMIAAAIERRDRGPGLLQQPEQPDRDRARREDRDRHGRADPQGLARHRHPDRRGVSRLRDRPVVRDRGAARAVDAERASSRARSRRPTAWPACASATRSACADTIKPLAQLKMPYNVSVFGVAAAIASLGDQQHIDEEREAQHRGPRLHRQGARRTWARSRPTRRATSSSSTSAGRRRTSATPAPSQGVMVGRDFPPFEKTHCRISHRDDGRDEEGDRGFPRRAESHDHHGRRERREVSHADTTHIRPDRRHRRGRLHRRARPREQPVGRVRAGARSRRARHDLPLQQRESAAGPARPCSTAIKAAFGPTGARPGRYDGTARPLIEAIAKKQGVKPENIVLGCGSTQILRSCTHLFTAKDKALVGTIPTYEECAGYAEMMGHPVRPVALDADFKIDLGKLAEAANGAGLVFYCNPNNPTATYVGARATREFLAKLSQGLARHLRAGRRGVLRLRHRSRSRHRTSRSPSTTRT